MSVHKEISQHSENQHARVKRFYKLDEKREQYIDEVIEKCKNNQPFTLNRVNAVTKEINELARQGIVPRRKLVTEEMVREYVERLTKRQ